MDHRAFLQLYCRICGERKIVPLQGPSPRILHPVSRFAQLIRTLHDDVDVRDESREMYPSAACEECAKKFANNSDLHKAALEAKTKGDEDALKRLARDNPVADFWSHMSSNCSICDDDNYDKSKVNDNVLTHPVYTLAVPCGQLTS